MDALGWDSLDVLLVSGDAYVDHPSFGAALLGRHLVSLGLRTGIAAQPRWMNKEEALADMLAMGVPCRPVRKITEADRAAYQAHIDEANV